MVDGYIQTKRAGDDNGSYFVKHDELTDVVACPGVKLPSLENSCYVPIEDIPDLDEE